MGRIVVLVLGLAALMAAVKFTVLERRTAEGTTETPKQTLDNAHQAATRIEAQEAQRVHDAEKAVNTEHPADHPAENN